MMAAWSGFVGSVFLAVSPVMAEQVIVQSLKLPFATLEQEVTYSTSKKEYEDARAAILARLQRGDQSARVNPRDGPWLRAATTAAIGIEIRGIGISQGEVKYRQVSAAEEALYLFENKQ